MGSRFNVFFADKYDANINEARDCKKSMHAVLKAAVADCISKAVELSGDEYDGYSGDIACGEKKLILCKMEFQIPKRYIHFLENGNDDWGFPYDDDWFSSIRDYVEEKCEKWGPSIGVRINGRWAIMGFYSD